MTEAGSERQITQSASSKTGIPISVSYCFVSQDFVAYSSNSGFINTRRYRLMSLVNL
jgi:hypothetical protein